MMKRQNIFAMLRILLISIFSTALIAGFLPATLAQADEQTPPIPMLDLRSSRNYADRGAIELQIRLNKDELYKATPPLGGAPGIVAVDMSNKKIIQTPNISSPEPLYTYYGDFKDQEWQTYTVRNTPGGLSDTYHIKLFALAKKPDSKVTSIDEVQELIVTESPEVTVQRNPLPFSMDTYVDDSSSSLFTGYSSEHLLYRFALNQPMEQGTVVLWNKTYDKVVFSSSSRLDPGGNIVPWANPEAPILPEAQEYQFLFLRHSSAEQAFYGKKLADIPVDEIFYRGTTHTFGVWVSSPDFPTTDGIKDLILNTSGRPVKSVTLYLVNRSTGAVVTPTTKVREDSNAFAQPPGAPFSPTNYVVVQAAKPEYLNLPNGKTYPTNYSELKYVIANSDGWGKRIGNYESRSGELRGGANPSSDCSGTCAGDPVNTYTGNFFLQENDMLTRGPKTPLAQQRFYDVQDKDTAGTMGYGWRSANDMSMVGYAINSWALVTPLSTASRITITQENGSKVSFIRMPSGGYESTLNSKVKLSYQSASQTFTLDRGDNTTIIFNDQGKLIRKETVSGYIASYEYNSDGTLKKVKDSNNRFLSYEYSPQKLIQKVTNDSGDSVQYGYDANTNLVSINGSNGTTWKYSYDSSRRIISLTNPLGGITRNEYNSNGQVAKQWDELNNLMTFEYSGSSTKITYPSGLVVSNFYDRGQLVKKTESKDNLSRTFQYSYDAEGRLTTIVNPDKSQQSMTYDAQGNQTSATDSANRTVHMEYNENNLPTKIIDPAGNVSQNVYDSRGNLTQVIDASGNKMTFTYNADGSVASVTDPRGNAVNANPADYTTVLHYNQQGLKDSTTNPLGNKTTVGYDTQGNITSTADPRAAADPGNAAQYTRKIEYTNSKPTKGIDVNGAETTMEYDVAGNITSVTNAKGEKTQRRYDAANNLVEEVNPLGKSKKYRINNMGQVDQITDEDGNTTTLTYDAFNRVAKLTDSLGRETVNEWDIKNNLISLTNALGQKTKYTYDSVGNLIMVTDTQGQETKYTYNSLNKLIKQRDAQGRETAYEYLANGKLSKITRPDDTSITYTYDAVGNLLSQVESTGKTESWTYDAANQKKSYTNSAQETTSYAYDANGNNISQTLPDGSIATSTYDARNLLTSVDNPGNDADLSMTYDVLGRQMTAQRSGSPDINYTYDGMGRVTSRGPPNQMVGYEYDNRSNLTKLTYPSGRTVAYSYDAADQMTQVSSSDMGTIDYTRNALGATTKKTSSTGLSTEYGYNMLNQMTSINAQQGSTSLYSSETKFNASGTLQQKTAKQGSLDSPTTKDFIYDPRDRLVQDNAQVFAFDDKGNLATYNGAQQTYNARGALLTSGGNTYSYDARGNRTAVSGGAGDTLRNEALVWTGADELKSVTQNNKTVTYSYDAEGLLSQRTAGNTTKDFVWDATASIPSLLSDGTNEYIYGEGRVPVAQVKMSDHSVDYLVTDELGSMVKLVDSTGSTVEEREYSTYGNPTTTRGPPQSTPFGFAGEWRDADTGYTYQRARWADSSTGSFLSVDPALQSTSEAYLYAGGDPVNRIDPLGLCDNNWLNPASDCYNFVDSGPFKSATNFVVAFGDNISLGGTNMVRDWMGTNNAVDKCDGFYKAGDATGELVSFFIPGGQFKGVVKTASKSLVGTGTKVLNDVKRIRADERGAVSITGNSGKKIDNAHEMGGRYGDLQKELKGKLQPNGLEMHHMPSNKLFQSRGFKTEDGSAIVIDRVDHVQTLTWGSRNKVAIKGDSQGSLADALKRDIADIRSIAGDKYDTAIENMMKYYDSKFGGL